MRHTPGLGIKSVDWKNRAQFLGIAAEIIRRILTHHARDRAAAKRGGHAQRVSLSFSERAIPHQNVDLISLDEAPELSSFDERKGRIVQLKFFGEMTNEEISEVLKVSVGTLNEIGILHMTGCIVQFLIAQSVIPCHQKDGKE